MVCDSPFSPSLCYPIRRPVRRPIHRPVVETRDPELARDICRTLLLRIRCCLEVRTLEEDTQMALGGGSGTQRQPDDYTDTVVSSISTTSAVAYADLFAKTCVYRRSSMFCIFDVNYDMYSHTVLFASCSCFTSLAARIVFLPQPPKARRVRLCIRRLHDQNLGFQRP